MKAQRQIDRDALTRMTDALAHRGPDGEGFFIEDGIGLGHRRLAIIDLAGGQQPFVSHSGDTVLCFNGEIYNYAALRKTLAQRSMALRTQSDTEALTEMWEADQAAALPDLLGMFAFAVWQKNARTLTLARDRLGEKPLYYATSADGFLLFASELPALMASGLLPADLSREAIADYFAYGYVPDPHTIYNGIHKLPPASTLVLTAATQDLPAPQRYWQVRLDQAHHISLASASEELTELLDRSVHSQMVSDVPLGAFLSGGVDSSGIVAAMALQSDQPVKTTTIGFAEETHDERVYAQQISSIYNTHHTEKVADLDVAALVPRIASVYGEPFADTSALPMYLVCQKTREQVTVALSGDGGDELFAGYRRYPFFLKEERVRRLMPHALRQPLFSTLARIYPALDDAPRPLRLKSGFRSLSETTAESYFRAVTINRPEDVHSMLNPDFMHTISTHHPAQRVARLMDEADTDDPLLAAQYVDLHTWLPGRMLTKVDRASMAHSLEVRPPILDHRLVEWAGRLPAAHKLQGHEGKVVLKRALEKRIPQDILYRPKQGFGLPVAAWLRAEKNNPLHLLSTSEHWRTSGFFDNARVEAMIQQHKSGQRNLSQELWSLIMFEAFLSVQANVKSD
ncbi:asparagine synthase (glutamine-hydrolyzing) [Parvularcula sp. IMCC14364]|uniref:asparagine synthase (glutamine-hydrolyzing) n=1 Tax=Parvularcula sp. IMCC14364 TaxID=3067902 RepID=UPI003557B99B